jgi:hypothetical protein
MVMTKAQQKAALKHIIEIVFNKPLNASIVPALSKATIPGVVDMITMSHNDIQALVYIDDSGTVLPLQKYKCNMMILFQAFIDSLNVDCTSKFLDYTEIFTGNTTIGSPIDEVGILPVF